MVGVICIVDMCIVGCVVLMVVGDYIIGDVFVYMFIKDKIFVDEFFW